MRRTLRRFWAITLGLALGWYAAGLLPGDFDSPPQAIAAGSASSSGAAADGKSKAPDPGEAAAAKLTPESLPQQAPFFSAVVFGTVGLFVAAVVLGVPALALKGEDPSDPADTHGHDESGASAHH